MFSETRVDSMEAKAQMQVKGGGDEAAKGSRQSQKEMQPGS